MRAPGSPRGDPPRPCPRAKGSEAPVTIPTEVEMVLIPEMMLAKRRELSRRYVIGTGVEIGALHCPLWTSPRACVRYVDRFNVSGLRQHYPELAIHELVEVDIIDDGE